MAIDTKYRSKDVEIMDDFSLEGEELRDALEKIAKINQLLGGNKVTISGIKKILDGVSKSEVITIVDFGCGNGDMLRAIADHFKDKAYNFRLIGIDANEFTINVAKDLSSKYKIDYLCEDLFKTNLSQLNCDIGLCTLTLHHFSNSEILKLISNLYQNTRLGLVINDLQRSKIAYRLFGLVCSVFNLNRMSKLDGQVSILRGFKKEELIEFSKKLKFKDYSIAWKWAFRYQWIIKRI